MPNERPMTEGEHRVVLEFNPSGDQRVDNVKRATAELIDAMNEILQAETEQNLPDKKRWAALAMTHYETAAMFAVKAITARRRT